MELRILLVPPRSRHTQAASITVFPKQPIYTHELGVEVQDVTDWDTSGSIKVQTNKSTHSSLPKVAYINGIEVQPVHGEDDSNTSEVHSDEDWDTSGSIKLQTYTIARYVCKAFSH